MHRRRLIFTFAFFIATICSFNSIDVFAQVQKIYLHPKTVATEKQTKFVDSIRFIPLETTAGIELGSNYNVNVTENSILLIDYFNKRLLIYTKDGKFRNQVSYKKLGENFYPGYRELTNEVVFFGTNKNYTLTPKDLVQIKLDWQNPKNRKYFKKYSIDLDDPSFAIKKQSPNESDILQVHHLYSDYYFQGQINVSSLYDDSLDHELKLYKNNQLVKAYFPYNRINEPRFLFTQENIGITRANAENIYYITRPYSDSVYKMTSDSLYAAYHIVLPLENTLPPSFFSKAFKNKNDRENFNRNNGWAMRQVHSFYETPKFIYFSVGYLSNYDSYIYDKASAVTFKTKNIKSDTTQYNLQLFQNYNVMRNGEKFYRTQKAGELVAFFEQNKSVAVPKELEEFLNNKPAASAPVIVEFTIKK